MFPVPVLPNCKDKIKKILDAGCTVLFTTKGIDDFAMKYLVDGGVLAVRRVDKKDTWQGLGYSQAPQ